MEKRAHENPDLYEDDLTDERQPTPVQQEEFAHDEILDPQVESDEPGAYAEDLRGRAPQ